MGFDIYMLTEPSDLGSDYQPQFPDEPQYWRFVSVGMGAMAELMYKAGVIETETPMPDWPWPPEGIPEERIEEIEEWVFADDELETEPTDEEKAILRPIRAQIMSIRSTRSADSTKVPAIKFATNDGWFVSPEECQIIATGLRMAIAKSRRFFGLISSFLPSKKESGISKKEAEEWILNWAAFNELSSRYGGYKIARDWRSLIEGS